MGYPLAAVMDERVVQTKIDVLLHFGNIHSRHVFQPVIQKKREATQTKLKKEAKLYEMKQYPLTATG